MRIPPPYTQDNLDSVHKPMWYCSMPLYATTIVPPWCINQDNRAPINQDNYSYSIHCLSRALTKSFTSLYVDQEIFVGCIDLVVP